MVVFKNKHFRNCKEMKHTIIHHSSFWPWQQHLFHLLSQNLLAWGIQTSGDFHWGFFFLIKDTKNVSWRAVFKIAFHHWIYNLIHLIQTLSECYFIILLSSVDFFTLLKCLTHKRWSYLKCSYSQCSCKLLRKNSI